MPLGRLRELEAAYSHGGVESAAMRIPTRVVGGVLECVYASVSVPFVLGVALLQGLMVCGVLVLVVGGLVGAWDG
jgi:hypothetical protein